MNSKNTKKTKKTTKSKNEIVPVLAAGDLVAFPTVLMSLYIVDEKNKKAVLAAKAGKGRLLMVATEKQPGENFKVEDLPKIGVVTEISRVLELNDGKLKVLQCTRLDLVQL